MLRPVKYDVTLGKCDYYCGNGGFESSSWGNGGFKLNYGISIIRKVKEYLPRESLVNLANLHVLSHLDYCSPLIHNLSTKQWDTLLKLQKRCACVIFSVNRRTSSKPLFIQLNWLPIHQRTELNTCLVMFKITNNLAPRYLSDVATSASDVHEHLTHSSASGCLFRTRGVGKFYVKTFKFYGTKVWNSLPKDLRNVSSYSIFKLKCKSYFMAKFMDQSFTNYGFIVLLFWIDISLFSSTFKL